MTKFELLVDGRREAHVSGEDAVRAWLRDYRSEHAETDPDAAHVQVRGLSGMSWLTGGTLLPRERFLD
ncbi:MAG TPA: hypothetical protein VKR23_01330 [Gaiellaceae bacterium]|nr:hypothetical protein [Gaiellaceae bacterium]